jgi:hypothetical protein
VPSENSCALKKKKMGRHRGRPSHDARIPPFYAPGVDAGESAGTGEGERGTADAGVGDGAGVGLGFARISSRRLSN